MKKGKICLTSSIIIALSFGISIFLSSFIFSIISLAASFCAFISAIICIIELKKMKEKVQNDFIIIAIGSLINIILAFIFGPSISIGTLFIIIGIPGLIAYDKV